MLSLLAHSGSFQRGLLKVRQGGKARFKDGLAEALLCGQGHRDPGEREPLTKRSFPKALASTQTNQGLSPVQVSRSELGRATALSSLTSIQSPVGGSWLPGLGTEPRVLGSQSTHILTAVSLPPQDKPGRSLLGVTHHPTLLPYLIRDEL